MNYLKTFKDKLFEFNVKRICEEHKIKNWSINKNGLVDVNGDVFISYAEKIPLRFGRINGSLNVVSCKLKSLDGSPHTIEEHFYCYDNEIKDLIGGPKFVGGMYHCYNNKLTSLEGAPETVGDSFSCGSNNLTSLKGCPKYIGGSFICQFNSITSLQYGPEKIEDFTLILPNPISNLPEEYLNEKYLGFILCNQSDWSLYRKDGTVYLNRLEEMIEWGIETGKIKLHR
jgi:hypothetical protein